MKRKWPYILVAVLCAIYVTFSYSRVGGQFDDTDTKVLLQNIQQRHAPLSWFVGDWPLGNHFYRPVSTLTFEMDQRLHPGSETGFEVTSAAIVGLCILALFWFVWALFGSPLIAAGCAVLFTVWVQDKGGDLYAPFLGLVGIAALVALVRQPKRWINAVGIALIGIYAALELSGLQGIRNRTMDWLPGRTATVAAFFALLALAFYARYERLRTDRLPVPPSPLNPPATRNTQVEASPKNSMLLAGLSLICCWLALSSYEQAVMLPACFVGVAVSLWLQGYRVKWQVPALSFVLLGLYLYVRHEVLPAGLSQYQAQQLRHGYSVFLDLTDYLAPAYREVGRLKEGLDQGPLIFVTWPPYAQFLTIAANIALFFMFPKKKALLLTGYGLSFLAFLPMAWSKMFAHYYFWPMAMRTVFVAGLIALLGEMVITGWSPQAKQAPERRDPAPGSLPHP
ncbi:MAG: hypothetical protein JSS72_03350 [Armatimonadetes bacterium]|nr:hypothetical protein [Armatimonadota bacterium]